MNKIYILQKTIRNNILLIIIYPIIFLFCNQITNPNVMNKYIIEILKVQSSVILPGLGALMVASTKTGKVVFNAHLKFNDGSLAKFIAEKEGEDKQDAENKVAKWIREIESSNGFVKLIEYIHETDS